MTLKVCQILLECLWCWRANPGLPEPKTCALPSTYTPSPFWFQGWGLNEPKAFFVALCKWYYQGAHGIFHGVIAKDRILLWPTYRRKKAWYLRMPNFNIPFVPFCVPAYTSLASTEGLLIMLFPESPQGLRSKPTMFFHFSLSADDLTCKPCKRERLCKSITTLLGTNILSPLC